MYFYDRLDLRLLLFILMNREQWRQLTDHVWDGKTMPDACKEMGLDWGDVYKEMRSADFRRLIVNISMLAEVREEALDAGPTDYSQ